MGDVVVWLIILLAVLTLGVWGFTFWTARKLKDSLRIVIRKANPTKVSSKSKTAGHEDQLLKMQEHMNVGYSFFANFTACFPLLGMLGTVKALIGIAGNMSKTDIPIDQFFSALNTTLAGLIGAIIFKAVFDSILSPMVAYNNNEVNTFVERNTEAQQKQEVKAS